jgi:hypothetical protein
MIQSFAGAPRLNPHLRRLLGAPPTRGMTPENVIELVLNIQRIAAIEHVRTKVRNLNLFGTPAGSAATWQLSRSR